MYTRIRVSKQPFACMHFMTKTSKGEVIARTAVQRERSLHEAMHPRIEINSIPSPAKNETDTK